MGLSYYTKGEQFFFDLSFPSHREVYHGCNFLYKLIMGVHNNLKEGRFPSLGSWSDNQRRQRRSLYLSGAQKIITIAYTLKTKSFQEWDKESSFGCSKVWCFSFGWKVGREFYPEWRESFESGFHLLALDNISTACTQATPQYLKHLTISPQHALKQHHS